MSRSIIPSPSAICSQHGKAFDFAGRTEPAPLRTVDSDFNHLFCMHRHPPRYGAYHPMAHENFARLVGSLRVLRVLSGVPWRRSRKTACSSVLNGVHFVSTATSCFFETYGSASESGAGAVPRPAVQGTRYPEAHMAELETGFQRGAAPRRSR